MLSVNAFKSFFLDLNMPFSIKMMNDITQVIAISTPINTHLKSQSAYPSPPATPVVIGLIANIVNIAIGNEKYLIITV